jgi:predicted acyltransferase
MKKARVASIDILRALTMVLMIWVNDFWSLTNIPKWLQHASATEDYLGFSDIIFPLFLFIVGLSIPFAIQQRKLSGASTFSTAKHIIIRSVSLLIIGVYMVNYESAHHESLLIGKPFWTLLMASAVVLIWIDWKRSPVSKKWHNIIQLTGFLVLIFLAVIYKGGATGELWMRTQWWGILGLIGWAYAINALVYLFSKGNVYIMVSLLLIFNALAVLNHAEVLPELKGFSKYFSTIYKGTIPAFTAAGIVASLVYKRLFALIGIIFVGYGFVMQPYWGISKIQGTPAWIGICTGIGFMSFALFYYIADVKKRTNWAKIIAPAGTATLTCYLIPYFVYPLRNLSSFRFPDFLNAGIIGLLGSFVFALLVVVFTGWMEKKRFKLKL